MELQPRILVVDDTPLNNKLLESVLVPHGYAVLTANSGAEALALVAREAPDLILLDVVMPGLDGYAVCRRLREDPATRFLPVVLVTASGDREKVRGLEAGADDFLAKPFEQAELLARVRSLLRLKEYQDTIARQAAELAAWNRTLEERVRAQVEELERLGRLRRFLAPQLAELLVAGGGEGILESHRRQIAVVTCHLQGFAALAETAEPEEALAVLAEHYAALGPLVTRFGGTVGQLAGERLMVFFNDPLPCPDPSWQAVQLADAIRECVARLTPAWRKRGHALALGAGIALGYATLGRIGFEGRIDYGAIGPVVNLAARLCDASDAGQVLLGPRAHAAVEDRIDATPVAAPTSGGATGATSAFQLLALRAGAGALAAGLAGLSAREREVLGLVARGLTDAQVADLLFLSRRTVSAHLQAIYGKLGVNTRGAAAHLAIEQGLA